MTRARLLPSRAPSLPSRAPSLASWALFGALVGLLVPSAPPSSASAQETDEDLGRANALYERVGADLSAAEPDLVEDERLLSEAIRLADRPQYRYALALVLRLSGRLDEAWMQLDRAARMPGSGEFEERIREERRTLERQLQIVEVEGPSGEAELRVYRRLPLEEGASRVALRPGAYELMGAAEGFSTELREVEARPGDRSTIRFDLEPRGEGEGGERGGGSVVEEPWFWAFVAALAVGTGVAVGLAVGLPAGQGEAYGGTTGVRFTP